MKRLISICLFAFLLSISLGGFAQKEVGISGKKYIVHTVTKSETVFSICQKYKVTQKEILLANPGLAGVLQAGTTIKIPTGIVVEEPKSEPKKQETKTQTTSEEYYYHKIGRNQTIPSIAKQYGVTANDLIRNNPDLSKGVVIGQVLKIPANSTSSKNQSIDQSHAISNSPDDLSGYIVHPVVSGETLYSLEQRYSITHEEMMKLNPELIKGLKTGMKLKISAKKIQVVEESAPENRTITKYKVEKGETLFSLANRFGIEVGELKMANPSLLTRGLETGETIQIPAQSGIVSQDDKYNSNTGISLDTSTESKNQIANESSDCQPLSGKNSQKYKAALLLPLYLPANDQSGAVSVGKELLMSKINLSISQAIANNSDTSAIVNGTNIDQKTVSFLEFYEGVLLAIDSLENKGMNIELYVFDVTNQQTINSLLLLDEFRDMNLIIGPVLPELQETVAGFAAKNRIPMISPLSTLGGFEQNNSYYFKVNPTREFQNEQTANYIAGEFPGKNFIMLQIADNSASSEAKLAQLSKDKLLKKSGGHLFHEYNIQVDGINSIKPLLDETGENVFFIPSDNEAQVSISVTNLSSLAENYNIVLMGTPTMTKFKSLQTENFHRIRLRFLSPYFVDYNKPLVRRFVGQYRELFSTEPSQFSFQGFDVSYYFLSALYRYGQDFRNCLPEYPMELTQMDFNFRKVAPIGGYMNQSLFVNSYERNFDILNLGVVGGK
jgi:LysM repeat protein